MAVDMAGAVTADLIILDLIGVLLGDKRPGRGGPIDMGLMHRIVHGHRHTPGCPHGQYLRPGGPRPHGDECSDRCQRAHAAISAAERWLEQYAASLDAQPRQMALAEVAG